MLTYKRKTTNINERDCRQFATNATLSLQLVKLQDKGDGPKY